MILLFSGGIDSFVAYHYLGKPPTVYFDLGTRYSKKELKVVKELIPSTIIDCSIDLGNREVGEKAYVPFRNLILACLANKYSDEIVIAGVADDNVSDKTPEAFESFSTLLSRLEQRNINVTSPFWSLTKEEVVAWYRENLKDDRILNTISCYSDDDNTYCGKCPSCFRKWVALRSNGYLLPFFNYELMKRYRSAAEKGKYLPKRNAAILREVGEYLNED